jgi:hypothetical protein
MRLLRMSVRRPKPDSLLPRVKTSTAFARVASLPGAVALLGDLGVGHEGLGPVNSADSDAEQSEADREAEAQRADANRGEVAGVDRKDEVEDHRSDAADERQEEQARNAASGFFVFLRVEIRYAQAVRLVSGIGDGVVNDDGGTRGDRTRHGWLDSGAGICAAGLATVMVCHCFPFNCARSAKCDVVVL